MKKLALILFILMLLASGCRAVSGRNENVPPNNEQEENNTENTLPDNNEPVVTEKPTAESVLALHPNEVGQVMVLMYHEIGGEEATWRRSVDNFRADLEMLYSEGYLPVHLNAYLSGSFNLPAGKTPYVLTFDDATAGQFRFLEKDGEQVIDPDCAVAILQQMGEKYADFTPAATFYVYYPNPFRQKDLISDKLNLLVQWGFEIGNHTYNHENLAKLSAADAMKALAKNVEASQHYLPGYQVNSLALPYGARPKDDSYLINGSWEGISYQNAAILLVGSNPAQSPFAVNFDPYRLPRVRADGIELPRWLEYFRKHPEKKYISDGEQELVTVPATLSENLSTNIDKQKIRLYNPDDYPAIDQ